MSLNRLFQIPRVQNLVQFSSFLFHFVAEGWRICRNSHFLSRNFPMEVEDRYRPDEEKVTAEARWAVLMQNYMCWGVTEWRERSSQSWKRKLLLWGVKPWNGVIISWGWGGQYSDAQIQDFNKEELLKHCEAWMCCTIISNWFFNSGKQRSPSLMAEKSYHGNNDICHNLEIAAAHLWRNVFTVSRFFLFFSIWFYFSIVFNQRHTTDADIEGGVMRRPPGCKGTTSWSTKKTETVLFGLGQTNSPCKRQTKEFLALSPP